MIGQVRAGFLVSICPPAVFNLVGTLFHPERCDTASLELGLLSGPPWQYAVFRCWTYRPRRLLVRAPA
jgi:hypothetical protein